MVGYTIKPVLNGHSNRRPKIGFQDHLLLNACHKNCRYCTSSTFIKLPFVIKIFLLSIVEWPLKTGFTVTIKSSIVLVYVLYYYLTFVFFFDMSKGQNRTAVKPVFSSHSK